MVCDVGLNEVQPMSSYDDAKTAAGSRWVGVKGEASPPTLPAWGQERSEAERMTPWLAIFDFDLSEISGRQEHTKRPRRKSGPFSFNDLRRTSTRSFLLGFQSSLIRIKGSRYFGDCFPGIFDLELIAKTI